MLSEATASRLFGTADAVGRDVRLQVLANAPASPVTATVVGITADLPSAYMGTQPGHLVYAPFAQQYSPYVSLVGRASGRPAEAIEALRTAVRVADRGLPVVRAGDGPTMLTGPYGFLRKASSASLALGLLTLSLAMVGLFGIQAHAVQHRTREIGVRLSLGASPGQIHRMILGDGYGPVMTGLAIGLFIGFSGRAIARAYVDARISLFDPWMLLAVPAPVILAALCACYLPAARAARIHPSVALRAE
jgi:ABC-type antimicrobial peptide transport system permease subunit